MYLRALQLISGILAFLLMSIFSQSLLAAVQQSEQYDFVWENGLRQAHFGDQNIIQDESIISLEAPKRAENAAIVPIKVHSHIAQSDEQYIKTITVLVDQNPSPLAGRFHFFPESGRADLALRVRVNAYTMIRAIAETNDGKLYLTKRFVKASGGCSAPAGTDIEEALSRMGKMKIRLLQAEAKSSPIPVQLNIRHPNHSGFQMDQITQLYLPAHFIKTLQVSYQDKPVLIAETDISISEDPSFRFFIKPQGKGELKVEVIDSKELSFDSELEISAPAATQSSS